MKSSLYSIVLIYITITSNIDLTVNNKLPSQNQNNTITRSFLTSYSPNFVFSNTSKDTCNSMDVRSLGASGNGKDDDTLAIQSTIDNCYKSGGGIVFVPEGDYLITKSLEIPTNITFQGTGNDSHIFTSKGTGKYGPSDFILITITAASHSTIRNIQITGAGKEYPGSDTNSGAAIIATNSSDITIDNIYVEDANIGISFDGTSHSQVTNSVFAGNLSQDAIRVMRRENGNNADNNLVSNNLILRGQNTILTGSGIRFCGQGPLYRANANIAANNQVIGCGAESFVSEYATDSTVERNTFTNCSYGMVLYDHTNGRFLNNYIINCPVNGILLETLNSLESIDNNLISGNVIINSGTNHHSDAVYIGKDFNGASVSHNNIRGNCIYGGNRRGINLNNIDNTILVNNKIINSGDNAINLTGTSTNVYVLGNVIVNPASHGIYADAGISNRYQQNIIESTNMNNSFGLLLNGTAESLIKSNIITGFSRSLFVDLTLNTVENNMLDLLPTSSEQQIMDSCP